MQTAHDMLPLGGLEKTWAGSNLSTERNKFIVVENETLTVEITRVDELEG